MLFAKAEQIDVKSSWSSITFSPFDKGEFIEKVLLRTEFFGKNPVRNFK